MPDENTPNEEIDETVEVGADGDATDSAWNDLIDQLRERGPGHSRYVFEGELARGGMGVIHRVFDRDARRRLALKVMLGRGTAPASGDTPDVADASLGRFLEEAQVTSQLDHPGIVPVHEIGVDETEQVYFTMKLVKGDDLRAVFDRVVDPNDDEWTTTRALNVMLRVCEAMAYAHTKGVIHRDLKPGNVMVGKFGEAYVMDWGLAKVLGHEDAHDLRFKFDSTSIMKTDRKDAAAETPDTPLLTMDGDVVGTPAYMPPEQAEGRTELLGPPADVYAVGAMLYHLIAGHMPYVKPGAKVSARTILGLVLNGSPPPLAEKVKDVPPELLAIIDKAMAREIADRYPDMTALARDLRAFLERRVVSAYEAGAWAEMKKWVQRNRALAGTALAAVVVVTLLTGLFLDRLRDERDLARANQAEAERQRNRANEAAEAERYRVLRLSDMRRLDVLLADANALWPAVPEKIESLREWLARANDLLENLHLHEGTLEGLRASGTPLTDPRDVDLAELRAHFADHLNGIVPVAESTHFISGDLPDEDDMLRLHVKDLDAQIATLSREIAAERGYDFGEDADAQWWYDAVRDLVTGMRGLKADDVHATTVVEIEKRVAWAETVEATTTTGDRVSHLWAEARDAIHVHPRYGGLYLKPQIGLVPLGPDPDSTLWEFTHLQTGGPAARDADTGKLAISEETGLVFVLIPGGTYRIGAQRDDPNAPHFDPHANEHESPVREVALSPYFLSKYEMTQGQWARFRGYYPIERWLDGKRLTRLPVENVSWEACQMTLSRLGLLLPTEAQWEAACRAGTETPWSTGKERDSLEGAAHPVPVRQIGVLRGDPVNSAPVGSYVANAFGLHDMQGNLAEWCRDLYLYSPTANRGDGLGEYGDDSRTWFNWEWTGTGFTITRYFGSQIEDGSRVIRGASDSRSAHRETMAPNEQSHSVGLRPARRLN